jgi:hypothetical protein
MSVFVYSHTIINITSPNTDISCVECHGWVQNELNSSAIHADLSCNSCHRFEGASISFATHNQTGIYPGNQSHAAYTPRCLDCHTQGVWIVNKTGVGKFASPAPAFNESNYGSDASAHKPFVKQVSNTGPSVGENEACIACHTNYSIEFEFKRPLYFNFWINDTVWYVSSLKYGDTNSTTLFKLGNGAKHNFKALNKIECEGCHSDVWQAANHVELNVYSVPKASHVCWMWRAGSNDLHNVSLVGVAGGYANTTEYCLLSCHKPTINVSDFTTTPSNLTDVVHAARRLSCYHCHNTSVNLTNAFTVWSVPAGAYLSPGWNGTKMGSFDANVFNNPLFMHGETCIACKRNNASLPPLHFRVYTEPNNTVYSDAVQV